MKDVFPDPGGPWRMYPLRNGMPGRGLLELAEGSEGCTRLVSHTTASGKGSDVRLNLPSLKHPHPALHWTEGASFEEVQTLAIRNANGCK